MSEIASSSLLAMATRQPSRVVRGAAPVSVQPRRRCTDDDPVWRRPLIRVLRFAFPAAAAVLIGTMISWPYLAPSPDRLRLLASLPSVDLGEDREAIIGVTMHGIDRSGRPYGVVADVIRPLDEAKEHVALSAPILNTATKDGRPLSAIAHDGTYDQHAQQVTLTGAVQLIMDRQYRLETEDASLDLDSSTAQGDKAVEAHGPFGRLNAQGFRIEDGGNTMVFTGRSRMVIDRDAVVPQAP